MASGKMGGALLAGACAGIAMALSACGSGTESKAGAGAPGAGGEADAAASSGGSAPVGTDGGSGAPTTDAGVGAGGAANGSGGSDGATASICAPPVSTAPTTAAACFADISNGPVKLDYDQFKPVMDLCAGTHQQTITGVERIVFLGDSITNGDVISPKYVDILVPKLLCLFPNAELSDCSKGGARNDDFLTGGQQIQLCFPSGVEQKKTLVVFTMGGNDIAAMAKDHLAVGAATTQADTMLQELRDAVTWLKAPEHFPNGSYVVYSDVYEFTDTSGDLTSCPLASVAGFSGTWAEGAPVLQHINEQYLSIAVETGSDMVFMEETFCGHGYKKDDATLQCYRGANTPIYFDLTCIHPNADGANAISGLFFDTIAQ